MSALVRKGSGTAVEYIPSGKQQALTEIQPVTTGNVMPEHWMESFEECNLFNSEYAYRAGYSRAVCQCGWKSIPARTELALVAMYNIHVSGKPI